MTRTSGISGAWLLGLAGFGLLTLGDSVIKTIAGQWPGMAVAALRFAIGTAGLGMLLWLRQGRTGFALQRPWLQVARGLALAAATAFFFSALHIMPLAEATAIQFASPVLTALLSAALLGERIRRTVWGAIGLAFVGVLIVLRPNIDALGIAALLPLGAAAGMAALILLNRATTGDVTPLGAQFFVAAAATPFLAFAAMAGHLTGLPALQVGWPDLSVVLRCALVAVSASTAHGLIYLATMRASAATIAPTVYVQILVATLIGILWFGDWPDAIALGGTALIIAAGIWLWRQGRAPDKGGS